MIESNIKRDLLFLVLLIGLIKVAIYRNNIADEVHNSFIYASAATRSLRAPMAAYGPTQTFAETDIEEQPMPEETPTPVTKFISEPVESAPQPPRLAEAETPLQQFNVHEIAHNIVQDIETAQAHINQLLTLIQPTTKQAAQLHSMHQRLVQLKKAYKTTSPAIALLGPIGTAGIIIKENELEKNLLRMINMTRIILQKLAKIDEQNPYTSIAQGLEENAQLIAALNNNTQSDQV